MRQFIFAAAFILPFAMPVQAAPADEVKPLAAAFDAAQVSKDVAILDRSLADELVFIHSSGRVADKADFMASSPHRISS